MRETADGSSVTSYSDSASDSLTILLDAHSVEALVAVVFGVAKSRDFTAM